MSSFRVATSVTHRAGGNIETAGQLLLWQGLGVKQGEQLLESGVGQLGHEGGDSCRAWWVDVNKGSLTSQAPPSDRTGACGVALMPAVPSP